MDFVARPMSLKARERILTTSETLLIDAGLGSFTVDEVATLSGVAKSTIYRHFTSANELLIATLDQMIEPFPTPDTGTLREDLIAIAHTVLPSFGDPNLRRLLIGVIHAATTDDDLHRIHRAMIDERKCPLRAVLDAAMARGELPSSLPFEVAFDHLEGPFATRWLHHPETLSGLDIEDTIDRAIAALRAGTTA